MFSWSAVFIILCLLDLSYVRAISRQGLGGRADFVGFYAVGKLIVQHKGAGLYSAQMQTEKQAELFPSVPAGRVIFNHLAYEALIFAPISALPPAAAYVAWVSFRILLLLSAYTVLLRHFDRLRPHTHWLFLLLLGFPALVELMIGQDTILVFFLYALAFDGLAQGKQLRAGCYLGLALFKFHLVLPFMIPFLVKGHRKFLAGFGLTSVAMLSVSAFLVGMEGVKAYAAMITGILRHSTAPGYNMIPNLHGSLFSGLAEYLNKTTLDGLVLVCSLFALIAFLRYVGDQLWDDSFRMPLVFSLNILLTLFVSYFIHLYDLVLLAFPVLALANRGVDNRPIRMLLMAAVVLGAPLYIFALAYRQAHLLVLIPFVLALGITLTLRSGPPTDATQEQMLEASTVASTIEGQ